MRLSTPALVLLVVAVFLLGGLFLGGGGAKRPSKAGTTASVISPSVSATGETVVVVPEERDARVVYAEDPLMYTDDGTYYGDWDWWWPLYPYSWGGGGYYTGPYYGGRWWGGRGRWPWHGGARWQGGVRPGPRTGAWGGGLPGAGRIGGGGGGGGRIGGAGGRIGGGGMGGGGRGGGGRGGGGRGGGGR